MTKLLAHNWICAPFGAAIYLLATVLFWQKPQLPPRHRLGPAAAAIGASWNFTNSEADQLIAELKLEKKSVQQRQQQLDDLALRLNTERAELSQVIQTVRQLQTDFDNAVLRVRDQETGNLKKLAKIYAAMSPDTAASVLAQLDNAAIVKVLIYLKGDETAAILEAMAKKGTAAARRTAQLSEQLRLSSHPTTTP
jgi:flagellar motility protein MotE (MotC chaperone)